jgi:hypothetical protein
MWLCLHLGANTCDVLRLALLASRMHLRIVQPGLKSIGSSSCKGKMMMMKEASNLFAMYRLYRVFPSLHISTLQNPPNTAT